MPIITENIFKNGSFNKITGFTLSSLGGNNNGSYILDTNMVVKITGTSYMGAEYKFVSKEAINFTNIQRLIIKAKNVNGTPGIHLVENPSSITNYNQSVPNNIATLTNNFDNILDLDVSEFTGNYYIFFRMGILNATETLTISEITTQSGSSIAMQLEELETQITNSYDAVDFKEGTIPQEKNMNNLPNAIISIPSGIDTSDATATASDIAQGKTAYVDGVKITGTATGSGDTILDVGSQDVSVSGTTLVFEEELPYVELDYIQATGTQWINTGIKPTNNTNIQYYGVYEGKGNDQNIATIFGVGSNNPRTRYIFTGFDTDNNSLPSYSLGVDPVAKKLSSSIINKELSVTIQNKIFTITVDGQEVIGDFSSTIDFSMPYNLTLFAYNYSGNPGYSSKGKLYSFKMYEGNTLVRDFIPAKRKSDNAICLYDKVSNTFFTNAGTGDFIAGNEV